MLMQSHNKRIFNQQAKQNVWNIIVNVYEQSLKSHQNDWSRT